MHPSLSRLGHPPVAFTLFFNFAARWFCSENNSYDSSSCADESSMPVNDPASVFLGLLAVACNFVGSVSTIKSHMTRLRLMSFEYFVHSLVDAIVNFTLILRSEVKVID